MMKMWKKVEETADECMQLEANFDIPLFDGDDGDMFDENDVNPFISSNQGFQTLVSFQAIIQLCGILRSPTLIFYT